MSDKMQGGILAGSTSLSIPFVLRKTSDNTEATGKVAADMTGSYWRQGGVRVSIPLSDLAAVNSAYSSGGVKEVDATNEAGLYRLDVPDAAIATGADWAVVSVKVGSVYVYHERFALTTNVVQSGDAFARIGATGSGLTTLASAAAVAAVQADTDDIQTRLPAALTAGGNIKADAIAISGDATAADNAESFFDGTGYSGTNNVIPVVTLVNGLAANTITPTSIQNDAITAAKIADGAIDAPTFAAGAINAAAIANDAITAAKIADGAIDANTFAAGAINAAAIAADAITAAKIADGAIDAATFSAGAIDAAAIAPNAIGASELAADAVAEIAAGVRTELAVELGRLDLAVGTRASQTSVDAIDDFVDTEVAAIKLKTDNLPSDPADASDIAASFATVNSTLSTLAGYVDTEVAAIKVVTDKLATAVELDGSEYRFTANALEQAPTGGAAPTAVAIADEVQTRTIAAVTLVNGLAPNTVTASAVAADAVTEIQNGLATAAAVAAVAAKTGNLPSDPADASDIATATNALGAALGVLGGKIDTIDGIADAIVERTGNLPDSPAATGDAMTLTTGERGAVADKILTRHTAGGSDVSGVNARNVKNALRTGRNRTEIVAGVTNVYEEDDTTLAWTGVGVTAPGDPLVSVNPA